MNMNTFCVTGNCYLPQPPRAWSRVQNSCSVIAPTDDNELVQVPYTTEVVPYAELGPMLAMINKGNVLQYKKNSSNLTQWQKYSLIAKGKWVNRTTTWASQSTRGYTNPNTQSLLRVGGTNVTLNGVPTDLPVTCPRLPIINNNVLPSNGGGGISNPPLPPPPPPPTPGGSTVIPIIPIAPILPIVIPDFGNLVCGTKENLCTGEIFEPIKLDNCHPTTDSDVPGTIQDLCWNDGNPTWYPRQRYVMSNSTDKWPVNAIVGSAVKPSTPILSVVITNCNNSIVTLSWNFDFECLPITSYNIYQNGELFATISGSANSYSVGLDAGTYSFSIIGINNGIFSDISNVVTVTTTNWVIDTNGSNTNFNPLTNDPTVNGYTYVLFNDSNITNYYFNSSCDIPELYYMIVGPGSPGHAGSSTSFGSIGGAGGGAGGIYNYVTSLSSGNYLITIPAIDLIPSPSTIIQNALDSNIFNITADSGIFITRGAVTQTVNYNPAIILSPSSSLQSAFGVGGKPASSSTFPPVGTIGGPVYTTGTGNFITFMGDGVVSNTLFGGGGGGGGNGGTIDDGGGPGTNGYNGGGGGGGGGNGAIGFTTGGLGLNGNNGNNSDNGCTGGNAFTNTSIPPGYGAGGGGGGGIVYSGDQGSTKIGFSGGTGGSAMLMIYFKT